MENDNPGYISEFAVLVESHKTEHALIYLNLDKTCTAKFRGHNNLNEAIIEVQFIPDFETERQQNVACEFMEFCPGFIEWHFG